MIMSPVTVRLTVASILDKRGLTTAQFADMAKITYPTALQLRRGFSRRVDMSTIERIVEALNIDPGELFVVEEEATK